MAREEGRIDLGVDVERLALAGETIQVEEIHMAWDIHKVGTPGKRGHRIAGLEEWGNGMEGSSFAD